MQGTSLESEVLRKTAERSNQIAAEIQSVRSAANSQMVPVLNQWKGAASQKSGLVWTELDAHLDRLHQALCNIGEALGIVQTRYVTTDEEQGQQINQVGQQASSISVALGPQ
jgi:WXG100 family type VII secretion target